MLSLQLIDVSTQCVGVVIGGVECGFTCVFKTARGVWMHTLQRTV